MIQRIQSLYLAVAAALLAVSAFGASTAFATGDGLVLATLSNFSLSDGKAANALYSVMGGVLLAAAAMSATAIFLFRNRRRQMRLCLWCAPVLLAYYAMRASSVIAIARTLALQPQPDIREALPAVALVLICLAWRAVRHDDRLVRDSYRIR